MEIKTEQELRTIYGEAKGRAKLKQLPQLEAHSRRFIELSPFLIISTANDMGELDASPRGGEAGFVTILDDHTLLIPDAKGNNRLDSLVNILSNHQIGCLFLIPGVDETLRINGIASIHATSEYLEPFSHFQNTPVAVIRIQITEVFLHCAKALMRSKLWNVETQIERSTLPTMGQMMKDQLNDAAPAETQQAMLERYVNEL